MILFHLDPCQGIQIIISSLFRIVGYYTINHTYVKVPDIQPWVVAMRALLSFFFSNIGDSNFLGVHQMLLYFSSYNRNNHGSNFMKANKAIQLYGVLSECRVSMTVPNDRKDGIPNRKSIPAANLATMPACMTK